MTQKQLAERLGVNATYITNVEAGRLNLTVGKIAELSDALGAAVSLRLALPPALNVDPEELIADPHTAAGRLRRDALLDDVASFILEHGVIDFSIKQAAIAAGTDYRVLLHYFGSAPELIREALDHLRQRRATAAVNRPLRLEGGPLVRGWSFLTADEPAARALLEGLALAVAQPEDFASIAVDGVDQYMPFIEAFTPPEWDDERRMAVGTLSLAVIRGLMLDWLATHDADRTDAAMQEFERLATEAGWIAVPTEQA
jgi:transcriptional regulator with XRE-family HTH domain